MMPRGAHRRIETRRGRRVVTVLLVLVAAGATTAAVLGSSGRGALAPRVTPTATVDAAATQACEVAVARGRDAVAAAQPAYSHWSGHVKAQLDYDAKIATLEQTRARWAATKATGDADIAQFRTAYDAFDAVKDGCAADPGAPRTDPVLGVCRSELGPVSAAVAAGKGVVDDWSAHVTMMKGKEHTDPRQYGQMWREMVRAAPLNLGRFAAASLELRNHVDCPAPF